jgi:hypothetical protein
VGAALVDRRLYSIRLRARRLASFVQLAAFVIGGIVGPVWHLSHHQHNHSHVGAAQPSVAGESADHHHVSSLEAVPPGRAATPAHSHAAAPEHRHHHGGGAVATDAKAHGAPAGRRVHRSLPPTQPAGSSGDHQTPDDPNHAPNNAPVDHGRGSVAHLGLALLGVLAQLPVSLPETGDAAVGAPSPAVRSLFHPTSPRPRPPPFGT